MHQGLNPIQIGGIFKDAIFLQSTSYNDPIDVWKEIWCVLKTEPASDEKGK